MSDPLSNRLNQWEASPPPGAWEFISREMKEWNAEKRMAKRMDSVEIEPPAAAWSAISKELPTEQASQPFQRGDVPVRPLYPYLLRYGAAAAIIGLIAWFVSSNPFNGAGELTTAAIPIQTEPLLPAVPAPGNQSPGQTSSGNTEVPQETQEINGAYLTGNKNKNRKDPGHSPVKKTTDYTYRRSNNWQQELSRQLNFSAMQSLPVQQRDLRYIRIPAENGNPVRLSAKYAPVYYQLTNNTEKYNSGNHPFNRIEQQLLRAQYVPDPGNLFDLLQLKELLEEQ
ncbi:hypothetical protein [Flavihumibacter sp. UBA7668]|uniref:hypothetical protein n=1 Tax=Flavihumibacter sp. UBA7668 TaxID=1946542 RepID=UPI0025C3FA7E|nr:hypothetical protein [Flavihumibacter sp. UBA7668]